MWPFRRKYPASEPLKNQFTYKVQFWPQKRHPYVAIITETSRTLSNWDSISAPHPESFKSLDSAHDWAKAEIEKVKRLRAERDAFNAMGLGEPRD